MLPNRSSKTLEYGKRRWKNPQNVQQHEKTFGRSQITLVNELDLYSHLFVSIPQISSNRQLPSLASAGKSGQRPHALVGWQRRYHMPTLPCQRDSCGASFETCAPQAGLNSVTNRQEPPGMYSSNISGSLCPIWPRTIISIRTYED